MTGFWSRFGKLFAPAKRKIEVAKRFEILKDAISGTMSNFHQARDIANGKIVGLKLLDKEKTKHFEARFKGLNKPSEGEISMKFHHPRVVETTEYGETLTGQPYVVMQFIPGTGLNILLADKSPVLNGNRLILIRHMLEAIEAVHEAGFIHRDICPRNFICAPDGKALTLIDFGLTVPAKKEFMQPGNRTGTPLYMAPEIVRRRPTSKRVDLFSFGVTAYYLLAGEHPWAGSDTTGKAALQHDTSAPRDLKKFRPKVNSTLAKLVHQCLNPDPDKRPESAAAALEAIRLVAHEDGEATIKAPS
jgi:serine/threonine-protein kinase